MGYDLRWNVDPLPALFLRFSRTSSSLQLRAPPELCVLCSEIVYLIALVFAVQVLVLDQCSFS